MAELAGTSRTRRSPSAGGATSSRASRTARWEGSREGLGSSELREGAGRRVLAWCRQERRKDWLDALRSLGTDTTVSVGFECRGRADNAYSFLKHSTNTRSRVTRSVFFAKGRWNTGYPFSRVVFYIHTIATPHTIDALQSGLQLRPSK